MATNLLSDRAVQSAKPRDTEYELRDGGGLSLRVKKDGAKIWAFRYTKPDTKKQVREYLGSYPVLKLADAREAVAARRTLVAKSIDPGNATALLSDQSEAPATVGDLYDTWYAKHVEPHRSSKSDKDSIKSRFENYVRPRVGDIPLSKIRRGQLMTVIDAARDANKMRTANLLLGELGQMFRYAAAREWIQGDPTAAITRKDAGGQDNESDRVLDDAEIVLLRDILATPPESKSRYYTARRRVLSDRQTRAKPIKGRKNSTILDLPGGHWTQHDLRRTGATIMGELDISSDVIDLCLNHKKAKKTTRTYQRQTMLPQRQEAFDILGSHLTKLLGEPANWLPSIAALDEEIPRLRD